MARREKVEYNPVLVVGAIIFVLLIFAVIFNTSEQGSTIPQEEVSTLINYEVLEKETLPLAQNFDILISPNDVSEEKVRELVAHIVEEECSKDCNVFIWDNRLAYQQDKQRRYLSTPKELNEWDEKNYVFVADHSIAWKSFEGNSVSMYPDKDWRYEELKK